MCGIAGFVAKKGPLPSSTLEAMTLAMSHRGPDDQGFFGIESDFKKRHWQSNSAQPHHLLQVGFGFRRLAILDLSSNGAQPMTTPDGRFTLIFNGQIYNYVELRALLPEVSFRSTSDTEVLLHLLAKFGMEALPRLNGIFAFALWDHQERVAWLVRDPLGVKPLYYQQTADAVYFSSEIRCLRAKQAAPFAVEESLLERYLLCSWIGEPDTLFAGVKKLPGGCLLRISDDGESSERRYWDLNYGEMAEHSPGHYLARLEEKLAGAVTRQLRSDVPVGFFLSGGVDSSLLAVEALAVQKEPPTTFTIGFKWGASKEDDLDRQSARLMADRFPFRHHEFLLEPSIVGTLPKVIDALEEPINDPAAVCSYLICERAAAAGYKVLISGQGGDEIFGGYPTYQAGRFLQSYDAIPRPLRCALSHLVHGIPYSVGGHRFQSVHRLRKFAAMGKENFPLPFFLLRSPFTLQQARDLMGKLPAAQQQEPFALHADLWRRSQGWDDINRMMYVDAKTYLPSLNLAYSDKTSMRHSVELRVPLLDLELVELMRHVPVSLKTTVRRNKVLLKDLAAAKLPREIIDRPKTGFGLPVRDWFLQDLQPMASDLLSESSLRRYGYLDSGKVQTLLQEHRERKADHGMKLYSLLTLQSWLHSLQ